MRYENSKQTLTETKTNCCKRLLRHTTALLSAAIMLSGAMLFQQGCSMESVEHFSEHQYLEEEPGTEFNHNLIRKPMVLAIELDPGLPGCEEALADPSLKTTGDLFDLYRIAEAPDLGLLTTDYEQICISEYTVLQIWLTTGEWVMEDDGHYEGTSSETKNSLPTFDNGDTRYESPNTSYHQAASHSLENNRMQVKRMFATDDSSTNMNTGGSASSDPVEDSNPLPPRINPL